MPIGICNPSHTLRSQKAREGSWVGVLGVNEEKSPVNELSSHWVRPSRVGAIRAAMVVMQMASAAIAHAWVQGR